MKYDDTVLFNAQRYSIHNMDRLIEDKKCGCFYCGSIFEPKEIHEWTDAGTALCPYCGIDAILGEYTGLPVVLPFLTQMHEYWFGDAEDMPTNACVVEECFFMEQYTVLRLNKPLPKKRYDACLIDNHVWGIVPAHDMPQCIAIYGKHDFIGKTVRFLLQLREDDRVDLQRRERAERLLRVDPEMAHRLMKKIRNEE